LSNIKYYIMSKEKTNWGKPQVYARIGFTDLLIKSNNPECIGENKLTAPKYITISDTVSGKIIGEIESSLICYELEDGTECDEDGTEY